MNITEGFDGLPQSSGGGEQLRKARQALGISLSGMARRTNFSKSYLGLVETGRKRASAQVLLAYERVVGGEQMNRRGLITGAAAGLLAPQAVSDLIREGFTAAISGRLSLDDWLDKVAVYGHEYMVLGADELRNRLARDLVVLQQNLETKQMWAVASRLMTLAGKTAGDVADSAHWYDVATIAADRSEDLATRVWVRGRAAVALAYDAADVPKAHDLATAALALDDRPTISTLNALHGLAHVHALRGQTKEAIKAHDAARKVFDAVGDTEQISDYAVPEWRWAVISSLFYSRLGDERAALSAQETALRTIPGSVTRFGTHIDLHRGLMLARAGDRTGGRALARNAMAALPEHKRSQSQRLILTEVERAAK